MGEKWQDVYQSRFLSAEDVKVPTVVTVVDVKEELAGSDIKPFVYTDKFKKPIVMNRTNCKSIARVTKSDKYTGWIGKQVLVYTAPVPFRGEEVQAIRIKEAPESK